MGHTRRVARADCNVRSQGPEDYALVQADCRQVSVQPHSFVLTRSLVCHCLGEYFQSHTYISLFDSFLCPYHSLSACTCLPFVVSVCTCMTPTRCMHAFVNFFPVVPLTPLPRPLSSQSVSSQSLSLTISFSVCLWCRRDSSSDVLPTPAFADCFLRADFLSFPSFLF